MRVLLGLVSMAVLASACLAEPAVEAANLRFQSFFAQSPRGRVVYTLLGSGFFRSMRTDDADKIVDAWVVAHPHARVVPIGELPTGANNVQLIYAWLEDGSANLNIELVRRGAIPSGTLMDPVQRFDASPADSPLRHTSGRRPQRLVPDRRYKTFIEKVAEAEAVAKRDKNGIWSDRYKETRELERIR